jgi:hypothetical protein
MSEYAINARKVHLKAVTPMKASSAMKPLNFRDDSKLFDGHCVRLDAFSGEKVVHCGITLAALKQIDPHLPHEGLLPSELFVEAFDRNVELIEQLCCLKYQCQDFEREGGLDILIHRKDIFALRT